MTQRKMKRTYVELVENHIQNYRQMVFLAGPRQVGKTTVGKSFAKQFSSFYYFNWDEQEDRQLIIKGPKAVGEIIGFDKMKKRPPLIVFDEIHKNRNWKQFLKGFFDLYGEECQIIVTGSAKLNVFKAGGDSLMGRYFLYRVHPLSVGELIRPTLPQKELHPPKPFLEKKLKDLLKYGGFPEPFLR
ncbi:MAG: AAA family ATPase, partial [Chlamydiia bacterium]|nr:AAA family ATPase [Chlamydiia bacterium]